MKIIMAIYFLVISLMVTVISSPHEEQEKFFHISQGFQIGGNQPSSSTIIASNKNHVPKKITYKDIDWVDLVPKDWNPAKELDDIDFDTLVDGDPKAGAALMRLRIIWDAAPAEPSLDGKNIRITGFAVPLEGRGDDISEFLLVPYFGACIHTPPPPANQIIHVFASKTPKNFGMMYPYTISGTLKIDKSPTDMGFSTYVIQADSVQVYKENK